MRDISIDSESIIEMNLLYKSISISLGIRGIGCKVEVEISHLTLISTIAVQYNFDVSLFWDPFGDEELPNWGSDGCDVKCLSDIDDFIDWLKSLFSFIDELGMIRVNVLGYFSCKDDICAFLHAYWEGSQLFALLLKQGGSDTGDETWIKPTGKKTADRSVGHQPLFDCILEHWDDLLVELDVFLEILDLWLFIVFLNLDDLINIQRGDVSSSN